MSHLMTNNFNNAFQYNGLSNPNMEMTNSIKRVGEKFIGGKGHGQRYQFGDS